MEMLSGQHSCVCAMLLACAVLGCNADPAAVSDKVILAHAYMDRIPPRALGRASEPAQCV